MKTRAKYHSLSLVSLLTASIVIVSCGEVAEPSSGSESSNGSSSDSIAESTEVVFPNLKFDGEEIVFLTEVNSYNAYTSQEIYAEEMNGSLINDAVYTRNLKVEEQFDVKIAEEKLSNATSIASSAILAGDDVYDVVMPYLNSSIKNALQGLYIDLNTVDYLELENPWWDQRANEYLTFGGKLYFTTGDISILDNECTMVLFFNKKLIEEYDLDDPYALVKSGEWTLDRLFSMSSEMLLDLNGDGEIKSEDDQFGLFAATNVPHSMFFGAGERITDTAADGRLELVMYNERSSELVPYIIENCLGDNVMDNRDFFQSASAFMESRVLFAGWALTDINSIRDSKFDFGILPYPKYNKEQTEYYSFISTGLVPGLSIPITNDEPEKAGLICEAMAYYSVDTLTAAYYDNALNTRYIRDAESGDMLDIIFASRAYDIGYIYDVGGLGMMIENMFGQKNTNFSSRYAGLEQSASAALAELQEEIEASAGE